MASACNVPNPWFGANETRSGGETEVGATTTAGPGGPDSSGDAPTGETSAVATTNDEVTTGQATIDPATSEATGDATTDVATTEITTMGGVCGDGVVDDAEECDDGNMVETDSCRATCVMAKCGDGIVWDNAEACDDGNQIDDDDCSNVCAKPTCGNGIIDPGESCDDGNPIDNDMCTNICTEPFCGDAVPQGDEECDDGNDANTDECAGCKHPKCGDGFVQAGVEACDDGNGVDNDDCLNNCKEATCGDGVKNIGEEECDDGNAVNTDLCTTLCTNKMCGDGVIQPGESCDDGQFNNMNGCNNCLVAVEVNKCPNGTVDPGEECDGGGGPLGIYPDLCDGKCRMTGCLRILNTPAEDLGFMGNEWLSKCTEAEGDTVVIALFDTSSKLVYAAHGTRAGWDWMPETLTAGVLANDLEWDASQHKYPVGMTSLYPPQKSGALTLPSRDAAPAQSECKTTLGDGYGVGVFPSVDVPTMARLLVMGYRGGVTHQPRLLAGWSPGLEISFFDGNPMNTCGEPNLKPFNGNFVMAIVD